MEGRTPKRGVVIAIDGPAGAGKSTLAHALADELGMPYLNTGLMYRALARRALAARVAPDDGARLARLAQSIKFEVGSGDTGRLLIDGREPESALFAPDVEAIVSTVASHPQVRGIMRAEQRALGVAGCVMEGRDIGSVVFPDADVKIFLSADPSERERRRISERGGGGEAGAAVARRDHLDAKTNPFVPAPDAMVLDSTTLDAQEVKARAMAFVRQRLGGGSGSGSRR
jgi:cytidylate kinase